MLTDAALAAALSTLLGRWGVTGAAIEPLGGGMNSATALVTAGSERYVAKWVPAEQRSELERGAQLAGRLAESGLTTGRPRLADGAVVVPVGDGWCVLAAYVSGRPLEEGVADQRRMAETLAAVHRVTVGASIDSFFSWFAPDLPVLDVAAWVRPAVTAALAAYRALPPLTGAWLHTDPAPEAFRHDPATGTTGLIDWTDAEPGPVLYDVASAVMYLGGPAGAAPFLAAYADAGVLPAEEWTHFDALRRYRWAVQAAYFADRLVRRDLTGTDDAGNRKGPEDARRGLGEWADRSV